MPETLTTRSLATLDFHAEFDADARAAAELLLTLLLRPHACLARIGFLKACVGLSCGARIWTMPGGQITDEQDFFRELIWIADGRLLDVVDEHPAHLQQLPKLASHDAGLQLALKCMDEGMPAIQELVDAHQQTVQDWLWSELASESLIERSDGRLLGRYVATWNTVIPFSDLIVADDPDQATQLACEKWAVSPALIAWVFVESVWQ